MYVDTPIVPGLDLLELLRIPLSWADHELFALFVAALFDVKADLDLMEVDLVQRYRLFWWIVLFWASSVAPPLLFEALVADLALLAAVFFAVSLPLLFAPPSLSPLQLAALKPLIPALLPPATSFLPFMQVKDDNGSIEEFFWDYCRALLDAVSSDTLLIKKPPDLSVRGMECIQGGLTLLDMEARTALPFRNAGVVQRYGRFGRLETVGYFAFVARSFGLLGGVIIRFSFQINVIQPSFVSTATFISEKFVSGSIVVIVGIDQIDAFRGIATSRRTAALFAVVVRFGVTRSIIGFEHFKSIPFSFSLVCALVVVRSSPSPPLPFSSSELSGCDFVRFNSQQPTEQPLR